jgi:hypothetical protein
MREPRRGERGTTIIEMAATAVVLTIVVAAVGLSFKTSFGFFRTSNSARNLERKANRGLEKVLDGLQRIPEDAVLPQLSAGQNSSWISYQRIASFVDGTAVYGPVMRLEWAPDPNDPEDGDDNDSDGLVDEGMIRLVTDPGGANEEIEVIVTDVASMMDGETLNSVDDNGNGLIDERGLCFEKDGKLLTVRVTLLRVAEDQSVVPWTGIGAVSLR